MKGTGLLRRKAVCCCGNTTNLFQQSKKIKRKPQELGAATKRREDEENALAFRPSTQRQSSLAESFQRMSVKEYPHVSVKFMDRF